MTREDRVRRAVGRLNSAGADAAGTGAQTAIRTWRERRKAAGMYATGITIWDDSRWGCFTAELWPATRQTAVTLQWKGPGATGGHVRALGTFSSVAAFERACALAALAFDAVARVTDAVVASTEGE